MREREREGEREEQSGRYLARAHQLSPGEGSTEGRVVRASSQRKMAEMRHAHGPTTGCWDDRHLRSGALLAGQLHRQGRDCRQDSRRGRVTHGQPEIRGALYCGLVLWARCSMAPIMKVALTSEPAARMLQRRTRGRSE